MNQIIKLALVVTVGLLMAGCGKESAAPSPSAEAPAETQTTATQPAANDADAMYQQARTLRDDPQADRAKIFELFKKSADLGHRDAMFFVGVMYENGESVPADEQKALEWYQKSIDAGSGAATLKVKELKAKLAKAKKK